MIRIYPTTTLTFQQAIDETIIQHHYQAVSLNAYLRDQDIDPFYIKEIIITTQEETRVIDENEIKHGYLGYLDDKKNIDLLFPKDTTTKSWLKGIKNIELKHKQPLPDWLGEDDV